MTGLHLFLEDSLLNLSSPCFHRAPATPHLVFRMDAEAMAPVSATLPPRKQSHEVAGWPPSQPPIDLLVLKSGGEVWLHRGEMALCHVTIGPWGQGTDQGHPTSMLPTGVMLESHMLQRADSGARQGSEDEDMDVASPPAMSVEAGHMQQGSAIGLGRASVPTLLVGIGQHAWHGRVQGSTELQIVPLSIRAM